jgi:hypothetical protein
MGQRLSVIEVPTPGHCRGRAHRAADDSVPLDCVERKALPLSTFRVSDPLAESRSKNVGIQQNLGVV